jgi:hypothetical protein
MKNCITCGVHKKRTMFYIGSKGRKEECMLCENLAKKKRERDRKRQNLEDERRIQSGEGIETVVYKRRQNRTYVTKRIYNADNELMFMQFNALIYRHIKEMYGLSRNEIDLLLLVYPIKPFTRKELKDCREIMEFKQLGLLSKYLKEDYIYVWRNALTADNSRKLFDFTVKGKKLMEDIHNWGVGKEKIPPPAGKGILGIMNKLYGSD